MQSPIAAFANGVLDVQLPHSMATQWANGNQVSLESHQNLDLDASRSLRILVEKDFKCLAPREDEDQSDAFDNPSDGTC